jgi:hypothetical protein
MHPIAELNRLLIAKHGPFLPTVRSEYWSNSKVIYQRIIERSDFEGTQRRYFTQVTFQTIGRTHNF